MFTAFTIACIASVAIATHDKPHSALQKKPASLPAGFKATLAPAHMRNEYDIIAQSTIASKNRSEQSVHNCKTTSDRTKSPVVDFWNILSAGSKYADSQFTPDESSLAWTDMGEKDQWANLDVQWYRAKDNLPHASLFGDGISTDDINQGGLGNCWFQAAASGLADKEGRLEQVFLNTENTLNDSGIYAVQLWALGVPHTVVIDDYLPMQTNQSGNLSLGIMGESGDDGSIWGAILEKAFAKYWGNYAHLDGGSPQYAIRTMTGAPWLVEWNSTTSADKLWATIVAHDADDSIITCGTHGNNDQIKSHIGLAGGHAYNVLGYKQLSNGVKLLKLRNPWGAESFTGDWSDSSALWTEALKAEVNLQSNSEDGFFYISLQDYRSSTFATFINYDVEEMTHDYFLMLNDDLSTNEDDWHFHCYGACSMNTIVITSEVDQTIYVAAHTWDERSAPSCKTGSDDISNAHAIWCAELTTQDGTTAWFNGTKAMKPYQAKAGEALSLYIDWNWNRSEQARDWSVTAWGDAGAVTVRHKNASIVTDHMTTAPAK